MQLSKIRNLTGLQPRYEYMEFH